MPAPGGMDADPEIRRLRHQVEEFDNLAASHEREVARLAERYPGACPSWVSTDLGIAKHQARKYREKAEDVRRRINAIERTQK